MKKVLIITYYWPPAGGPGVQRILKFVKYLSGLGWNSVVLTVDKGNYPAIDYSLASEIPTDCRIYKSKNREPDLIYKKFIGENPETPIPVGILAATKKSNLKVRLAHWIRLNLFLPDGKIFWKRSAIREGKKVIKKEHPDVILSTSPPPTVHLIAKTLSQWADLKWIADFRDPWSQIHYYNDNRSSFSSWLDRIMERKILRQADRVICVSKQFGELLETDEKHKISIIPNGFDQSDFRDIYQLSDKFRITYIGGLNENRYYEEMFTKIKALIQNNRELAEKLELLIAGSISSTIEHELRTMFEGKENLKLLGYLEHKTALELMINSDILLLFLEKVPKYEGHVPGKLFEYMATGNYILGLGITKGETAELISKMNIGEFVLPGSSFEKIIEKQFLNWKKGIKPEPRKEDIHKFSREQLTRQLADELEKLAE